MTRNLKALGLALVAVFAMSALVVSAAQAEEVKHTFTSEVTPTVLTGKQETGTKHAFTVGTGANAHTTTCEKAEFAGTQEGKEANTVTLKPTYSECSASGLGAATVRTNHCAYVFQSDTVTSEDAAVEVECAEGSSIEVEVPSVGVTLHIGAQTPAGGNHYTNLAEHPAAGGKMAVTAKTTVSGVHYTCSGGGCFLLEGGGTGSNGTYTGESWVTGYNDTGSKLEGTATTTPTLSEGSQVGVTVTTP